MKGRKRVLLIAAAILAARRIAQTQADARSPAFQAAIHDAIVAAERILQRIDDRWFPDGCFFGVPGFSRNTPHLRPH
jgi:hypothetical protein